MIDEEDRELIDILEALHPNIAFNDDGWLVNPAIVNLDAEVWNACMHADVLRRIETDMVKEGWS